MRNLGALAIVATIAALVLAGWFGFNYLLWGRITGPPKTKDFEAIAREGQPLAQAISDYRSDHGLLPESFSDLVPAYLPQRPKEWSWDGTCLTHRSGAPHTIVGYWFVEGDLAHWKVRGEYQNQELSVPGPIEKKSSVSADAIFATRLAEFEKRINTKPRDFYAYRDKIDFAIFSKSNDIAIAECERAAKVLPNWWLPPMALAVLRTNDTQAEQNFKSWVQVHPTFINYWYLSRFYRDKDDNDAAFAALDTATASAFSSDAAQLDEVKRDFRLAVQGKPSQPSKSITETPDDAYWNSDGFANDAARFCGENRNYALVLKIIRHCEIENMALQASAELGLGQFDAAIADAQKAAVSDPQSVWARNLPQFLQAAEAHNTNFWFETREDEDSDWALFQVPPEVSSINRDTAQSALYQGSQDEKRGDLDAAIADCTKAIQLKPRSAAAYNLRSWSEFLKKDFDASIADATRAIQLNLNYGNAYGTRGWARYGKGDKVGALDDLKAAVEICGVNSLEAIEDQGMIELINGHYQNALNSWQKAIQKDPSCQQQLQPWIEKAKQHVSQ